MIYSGPLSKKSWICPWYGSISILSCERSNDEFDMNKTFEKILKSFGQGKPARTTLGDIDRYLIMGYCRVTPSVTTILNSAIS